MTEVKQKIIYALSLMSEEDAEKLLQSIKEQYNIDEWDGLEEVVPDDIDLELLKEVEENPDCSEFVTAEEARRILGV